MSKTLKPSKGLRLYVHGSADINTAELLKVIKGIAGKRGLMPYGGISIIDLIRASLASDAAGELRIGISSLDRQTDGKAKVFADAITDGEISYGDALAALMRPRAANGRK